MRFVLVMALRELRASFGRLFFFFLCIAIGVAAIVALRSTIESMQKVFAAEARGLLAADVVITSNQQLTQEQARRVDQRLLAAGAQSLAGVDLATMVRADKRPNAAPRMVELRAIEAGFPLYGELRLSGGQRFEHALLRDFGVLVRPELLSQLSVAVGDALLIGSQRFTIRGVIEAEPGRRMGAFSLGPRIFIDLHDVPATGLVTLGSRASFLRFAKLRKSQLDAVDQGLRADLRGSFARVRSVKTTEGDIGDNFGRAESYLSLVGLVILILGGIGVASVIAVFVQQKIRSMAVLKCVGARSWQLLIIYTLQVLVLGSVGSALGVALAALCIQAIPASWIAAATPGMPQVDYAVTGPAAAQGVGIGLLVSLLFSIVPLLEVRHVKPSLLLRDVDAPRPRDFLRALVIALVVSGLLAITIWQAGSIKLGSIVAAGFALAALLLHLTGSVLMRAIAPLSRVSWFPLRHAVLKLTRRGSQARIVLLAVGLGSFFTLGVRSLQELLVRDLSVDMERDAPDMFLLDVQSDQIAPLHAMLQAQRGADAPPERMIPILRARVTAVDGRNLKLGDYEDIRDRGSLGREYTITYRSTLERNEHLVAGKFWDGTPSAQGEVSIEDGLQKRYGIELGDTMHFDVLGRSISAKVTSIRDVNWTDARAGGFMFVFRPGLLDKAPHSYIGFLRGPEQSAARTALQSALLTSLPNVSVIDGRDMLATIHRVVDNVSVAVSVVGTLVVVSGLLILIGAVMMTKYRRLYEVAIFKTLGATRRAIALTLLLEYGVLGALAGCVGALAAMGLTYCVSSYALDLRWHPLPGIGLTGVAVCAGLVAVVGVAASAGVLRRKPLATLKAE